MIPALLFGDIQTQITIIKLTRATPGWKAFYAHFGSPFKPNCYTMLPHFRLFNLIKKPAFLLILIISHSVSNGQSVPINQPVENLPTSFSMVTDTILVNEATLLSLFNKTENDEFTINLGHGFKIGGIVRSVSSKYANAITTVSSKLTVPSDLLFTFSRIVTESGQIVYRGLIMGKGTGDYLEFIHESNQFKLTKKDISRLKAE